MVFRVSDELWALIISCYEKGGELLSPTTKILVEDLLASLQASRSVTSSYEADLIVTLLLSAAQPLSDSSEDEDSQHAHIQAKDNWHEESTNLIIKINQVIEQLRFFSKGIEIPANDCSKEQSR